MHTKAFIICRLVWPVVITMFKGVKDNSKMIIVKSRAVDWSAIQF